MACVYVCAKVRLVGVSTLSTIPEGPGREECRVRRALFLGGSESITGAAGVETDGPAPEGLGALMALASQSSCSLENGVDAIG